MSIETTTALPADILESLNKASGLGAADGILPSGISFQPVYSAAAGLASALQCGGLSPDAVVKLIEGIAAVLAKLSFTDCALPSFASTLSSICQAVVKLTLALIAVFKKEFKDVKKIFNVFKQWVQQNPVTASWGLLIMSFILAALAIYLWHRVYAAYDDKDRLSEKVQEMRDEFKTLMSELSGSSATGWKTFVNNAKKLIIRCDALLRELDVAMEAAAANKQAADLVTVGGAVVCVLSLGTAAVVEAPLVAYGAAALGATAALAAYYASSEFQKVHKQLSDMKTHLKQDSEQLSELLNTEKACFTPTK